MDRRTGEPVVSDPLKEPADEPSPEDELWLAFGRAIGFTFAAVVLLLGGGIVLIVLAAAFFRFVYGH